jgi:hypothetical protein
MRQPVDLHVPTSAIRAKLNLGLGCKASWIVGTVSSLVAIGEVSFCTDHSRPPNGRMLVDMASLLFLLLPTFSVCEHAHLGYLSVTRRVTGKGNLRTRTARRHRRLAVLNSLESQQLHRYDCLTSHETAGPRYPVNTPSRTRWNDLHQAQPRQGRNAVLGNCFVDHQ